MYPPVQHASHRSGPHQVTAGACTCTTSAYRLVRHTVHSAHVYTCVLHALGTPHGAASFTPHAVQLSLAWDRAHGKGLAGVIQEVSLAGAIGKQTHKTHT